MAGLKSLFVIVEDISRHRASRECLTFLQIWRLQIRTRYIPLGGDSGDGLYLLVHSDVLSGTLVLVHSLALLVVLKIKLTFKAGEQVIAGLGRTLTSVRHS